MSQETKALVQKAADLEGRTLTDFVVSSVQAAALDETFTKRLSRYPALPATLLGRLAVDNSQKGKRFGELLLIDLLKKSLDASIQVASLAIIAEALDQNAVNFYLKYGFQPFK